VAVKKLRFTEVIVLTAELSKVLKIECWWFWDFTLDTSSFELTYLILISHI